MAAKFKISNITWIIIGCSIIITGLSVLFFKNFEKIPVEIDHGYSAEARKNEFLAAEMYLAKLNIEFSNNKDFSLLNGELGEFDTLLINSSRIGMSAKQREKMKSWVEQGGHLVLLATEPYETEFESSRDKFLDDLGFRFYHNEDDYAEYYEDEEAVTSLKFSGYQQASEAHFYADGYLEDTSGEAAFSAGPDDAEHLIQYALEDGLITIVADFSLWKNRRIDKHDHAMVLAQLIGESPKAWLVYNQVQPTLLSLMLDNAPLVLLSASVILILLLFSALWRVGAVKADSPAVHREIMQHISAAGAFSFREDQGFYLIQELLSLIEHRMSQIVHGYAKLPLQQQIKRLAHHTAIDATKIAILWEQDNNNADEFTKKIQLIQDIRKLL